VSLFCLFVFVSLTLINYCYDIYHPLLLCDTELVTLITLQLLFICALLHNNRKIIIT